MLMGPLADHLRPKSWENYSFQPLVEKQFAKISQELEYWGRLPNLLLWGPPGTGKTTFVHILIEDLKKRELNFTHQFVNAVDTGAKALKTIGDEAQKNYDRGKKFCVLFIDEIHRLNRAQQDVLLPHMEKGNLVVIGATTENPSYEMNAALLSRLRLIQFSIQSFDVLKQILKRALIRLELPSDQILSEEAEVFLIERANGDARRLLNDLEQVVPLWQGKELLTLEVLKEHFLGEKSLHYYDKNKDYHYDIISAFIKSIRGSDPDAGLYYLARMIEGGEDPLFIARRLVILASEDVGNADPRGLGVAVSTYQAVKFVGLPEAGINLAQAVTYLSAAPKSNRSYLGYKKALSLVKKTGLLPVPKSLRSAMKKWAKSLGYGKGYRYSHDGETGYLPQEFLPEEVRGEVLYEPSERGFEKNIRQYQEWIKGK